MGNVSVNNLPEALLVVNFSLSITNEGSSFKSGQGGVESDSEHLGSEIPLNGRQEDRNFSIDVPIESLKDRSFQDWVLRLPVRLEGLRIRSTLETRHAAFIGGVEQALPHFTNRESP